jgi:hypothetical protein
VVTPVIRRRPSDRSSGRERLSARLSPTAQREARLLDEIDAAAKRTLLVTFVIHRRILRRPPSTLSPPSAAVRWRSFLILGACEAICLKRGALSAIVPLIRLKFNYSLIFLICFKFISSLQTISESYIYAK